MTIADRIRNIRNELQLSQTELAERANYCDKTRISKIENSGNDISMKQVKRIASALGVPMESLMGWNVPKDTPEAQEIRKAYIKNPLYDLTDDEIDLIVHYRLLDDDAKQYVIKSVKANISYEKRDLPSLQVANDK